MLLLSESKRGVIHQERNGAGIKRSYVEKE